MYICIYNYSFLDVIKRFPTFREFRVICISHHKSV